MASQIAEENIEETSSIFTQNGKIGVVILVLCTIFLGIMLVLAYLDRRIRKIEKSL
ncbi:MAG TPA: hypothetical protein VK027_00800 [Chitinophagaceae bacterium]|nr:hypothetical protein [Chitinophagaceae bacterium]